MNASNKDILSLIPQRPPFVMIDRLTSSDDRTAHSTFEIKADNVLVNKGQLTEAGLTENIAQTAAAGLGYIKQQNGDPILMGYIGAIKNLEVFALPNVGEIIHTQVFIETQIFNVIVISGKVMHNDEVLVKCEMKVFVNN